MVTCWHFTCSISLLDHICNPDLLKISCMHFNSRATCSDHVFVIKEDAICEIKVQHPVDCRDNFCNWLTCWAHALIILVMSGILKVNQPG